MSFELDNISVLCVIPTFNGGHDVIRLYNSIIVQDVHADISFIDSDSIDGSLDFLIESSSVYKSVISPSKFNHGGTRQSVVDKYPNYDIYIFMTQDAYLADARSFYHIISPFSDPSVGAVCGRQLPHKDANLFASHARLFNYPEISRVSDIDDPIGIKKAFLSNSFSAYRRDALIDVGGFPSDVILSEDMFVGVNMLLKGWCICYSADAICYHSHNYTMKEEFSRYFDIGVFHSRQRWLLSSMGDVSSEGYKFVISELSYLGFRRVYLFPLSIVRNLFKFIGFRLGFYESLFNPNFSRLLSMNKRFWTKK